MSTDRREAILRRLEITVKISGVSTYYRNQLTMSDGDNLPAISLLDGEEIVNDGDNSIQRTARGPRRVTMIPEVRIIMQAASETIGTELSRLRMRLIKAVLEDETLMALTSEGQSVSYEGCLMRPGENRSGFGIMSVRFGFGYYLKAGDLT